MTFLDIILGGLLAFGIFKGLRNGLFVELASIISFIVGIYLALKFSHLVRLFIESNYSWSPKTVQIIAFVITFICAILGVKILAKIFTKIADFAYLGWINHATGAAFGMIRMMLLLGVCLSLFQKININNFFLSKEKQEISWFFNPIKKSSEFLFPLLEKGFDDLKSKTTSAS